jgi:hypothetical protein
LAVVASFRVHFTAENVRVFMLLYKGIWNYCFGWGSVVFWDVTLHHWVGGYSWHFKGTCRIPFQEFRVQASSAHVWEILLVSHGHEHEHWPCDGSGS